MGIYLTEIKISLCPQSGHRGALSYYRVTYVHEDFVCLRDNGNLLPLKLPDDGSKQRYTCIVGRYRSEKSWKTSLVREGYGCRCVANLQQRQTYMWPLYYIIGAVVVEILSVYICIPCWTLVTSQSCGYKFFIFHSISFT